MMWGRRLVRHRSRPGLWVPIARSSWIADVVSLRVAALDERGVPTGEWVVLEGGDFAWGHFTENLRRGAGALMGAR